MARSLRVDIIGDASSYQRALRTAGGETQTFGSKVSGLGRTAGLAAGSAGVAGLTIAVHAGISEYVQHAKVAAQTEAVLKSTGGVAGITADHVDSLANSIMKKSGIDDEAIQSSENLLLAFTNIRNEAGKGNNIFDRAAQVIQDYSVRTGKDATGATVIFGKALQEIAQGQIPGSIRGVGKLSEETKKEIAAHLEAGDVVGAQSALLQTLETRYGGAAEAAGKTLPGQLSILREEFNNLAGQGITIALDKLQEMKPAFDTFIGIIQTLEPVLRPIAALMLDVFVTPMKVITDLIRGDWSAAWDDFKKPALDAWNALQAAATLVWGAIDSTISGVLNALKTLATTVWNGIQTAVETVWNALNTAATTVWNAINTTITTIWNGLKTLATTVWDGIKTTITTAINGAKTAVDTAVNAIKTVVTTVWNGLKTLTTTTWNAIKTAVTTPINAAKTAVDTAVNAMKTVATAAFNTLKTSVTTTWEAIKTAITAPINAAKTAVETAAGAIKTAINGIISGVNTVINGLNAFKIPGFNIHIPGVSIAGHTIIPSTDVGWGGADPFPDIPTIPTLDMGGVVAKTGLAVVHRGETFSGVGGGAGGLHVTVNVNGALLGSSSAEVADVIYAELLRMKKRNASLGLA